MKQKIIKLIMVLMSLLLFAACGNSKANENKEVNKDVSKTVVVTDMVGREVEIPKEVNRIYCTNPIGTNFIYSIVPEKLIGWNFPQSEKEKQFFCEECKELPILGGWFGKKNTGNIEQILTEKPDLIVNMGGFADIDSTNKLQEQMGVPIVILSGDKISDFSKAYLAFGKMINEEEKAKVLANYIDETLKEIDEKVANIPEEKKARVYYAEGPTGLQTDPATSPHTEVLNIVGGINVADVNMTKGYGRTEVSLEQVLLWNPDVIITDKIEGEDSFFNKVYNDENWQDINAIKNEKIYGIPQLPFSWFDRPPSINRVIGLKWLANELYNEIFDYDMYEESKEFFELFYHTNLTKEQFEEII